MVRLWAHSLSATSEIALHFHDPDGALRLAQDRSGIRPQAGSNRRGLRATLATQLGVRVGAQQTSETREPSLEKTDVALSGSASLKWPPPPVVPRSRIVFVLGARKLLHTLDYILRARDWRAESPKLYCHRRANAADLAIHYRLLTCS